MEAPDLREFHCILQEGQASTTAKFRRKQSVGRTHAALYTPSADTSAYRQRLHALFPPNIVGDVGQRVGARSCVRHRAFDGEKSPPRAAASRDPRDIHQTHDALVRHARFYTVATVGHRSHAAM